MYSLRSEKYLKPNMNKNGYLTVELFDVNGKSKRLLIHRLVAMAYIPNPDDLPQINHIDENPLNNAVSNLEWCTAKYNMNYGNGAKTRHSKIDYTAESRKTTARINRSKRSKTVLQYSINGELIAKYNSAAEASRKTGANHSHIVECCNGKRYKTVNNFIWKYERNDDLLVSQF